MGIVQQLILIIALYLILGLFEALNPVERNQPVHERLRNMAFTLILMIVGGSLTTIIANAIPWQPPPAARHRIPITVLSVLIALFIWDLLFYWYHRAEHAFAWLWNAHEVHHSDGYLNTSSSLRHVWIEHPMEAILLTIPSANLLHLDALGVSLFSAVTTAWLLFVHANVKLHLGAFSPYIGNPQIHRIHHSSLERHRNKNFAVYFPFIDKIFGTYYAPAHDEFPPTGTEGMRSSVSWRIALTRPFTAWIGLEK